jgi:acyl-[acyl carrier protein]--UDP-N-acetylglucosamine O-acyltransferase
MHAKFVDIHPNAKIGEGVEISNFVTIYDDVEIGDGTWIGPNVTIFPGARIGKNCKIFPGAVIAAIPQDLKFNNDYDEIENEYRIHKFVNYILVNKLSEQYKNEYFNKEFNLLLKDKKKKRFLFILQKVMRFMKL